MDCRCVFWITYLTIHLGWLNAGVRSVKHVRQTCGPPPSHVLVWDNLGPSARVSLFIWPARIDKNKSWEQICPCFDGLLHKIRQPLSSVKPTSHHNSGHHFLSVHPRARGHRAVTHRPGRIIWCKTNQRDLPNPAHMEDTNHWVSPPIKWIDWDI